MKILIPEHMKQKVIELYNDQPFDEFTLENLKRIRNVVPLGFQDIKNIILSYKENSD